ncbi:MAG: helix-turn-helix transcriptional regulator [Candidatus Micrarchaeaceae archaeon]|jgi:DNA-binding PadR family transcriptional regulator
MCADANVAMKKQAFGSPYMTKDLARIVLKLIVLRHIEKKEVYSYALIKDFNNPKISEFLKKHGSTVKNDIYNTVKALEKSGYIKVRAKVSDGRLKKYYYITERGKKAIKESKMLFLKSMKELMHIIE